jgi:uncharacterized membrane protein YfcA
MHTLVVLALIGLLAQLVDGALGMAYGVTSTTLLLTAGIAPAAASASVHLAEVATTFTSGVAHWRFGNVDWRTVRLMALPGAAGAFAGAVALTSLSAEVAKPWMAGFLFALGVLVLVRFTLRPPAPAREPREGRRLPAPFLSPLGLFAGFMDAAGGGGWGPIGTPSLLATGKIEPRKVVGSIDTAEFLVALGASAGFLTSLSLADLNLAWVGALVAGGVVAAPVAAWLVRRLPAPVLGAAVGGLILLTNAKTLGEAAGLEATLLVAVYLSLALIWAGSVALAVRGLRRRPAPAV